jgi:hypothetical protein
VLYRRPLPRDRNATVARPSRQSRSGRATTPQRRDRSERPTAGRGLSSQGTSRTVGCLGTRWSSHGPPAALAVSLPDVPYEPRRAPARAPCCGSVPNGEAAVSPGPRVSDLLEAHRRRHPRRASARRAHTCGAIPRDSGFERCTGLTAPVRHGPRPRPRGKCESPSCHSPGSQRTRRVSSVRTRLDGHRLAAQCAVGGRRRLPVSRVLCLGPASGSTGRCAAFSGSAGLDQARSCGSGRWSRGLARDDGRHGYRTAGRRHGTAPSSAGAGHHSGILAARRDVCSTVLQPVSGGRRPLRPGDQSARPSPGDLRYCRDVGVRVCRGWSVSSAGSRSARTGKPPSVTGRASGTTSCAGAR